MKRAHDNTQRARRLLRWYPPSWRDRYGEEFVDHLEQEFEDCPSNLGRSINVVRKGVVARLGDIGLFDSTATTGAQSRAALGTGVALASLMAVVMMNFWSRAMLVWSGRKYHPIPVSATTGTLTVVTALMLLVLAAIVIVVVTCVVRQIIRRRARPLAVPSTIAVVTGGFLLYEARVFPRLLSPYLHGAGRFQGMSLSRPGQLLANMAQVVWETTQRWVDFWNASYSPISRVQYALNDIFPLVMFVFGIAIAVLIRRIEFPQWIARVVFPTVALLGGLSGVYFVAYLGWNLFGGPSDYDFFFRDKWLGIVYLILLGVVPLLVIRSGLLARKHEPSQRRNHIEILNLNNASND
jgi:hypothetical protein